MRNSIIKDESGLVSIVVTMIVMALLTLLAVGFSSLSTKEYQQALDQQLNTQSFYAAESGINRVIADPTFIPDCSDTPTRLNSSDPNTSEISCIKLNNTPSVLVYSDLSTEGSMIIPVEAAGLSRINIYWQDKSGKQNYPNQCDGKLLSNADWNNDNRPPVLTAMIMPDTFSGAGPDGGRDDLINKTQKLILYPTRGATCLGSNTISVNPLPPYNVKGQIVNATCSNPPASGNLRQCRATITGIEAIRGASNRVLVRLRSVYSPSDVMITAQNNLLANVGISGSQREIDSTGRVAGVLRRIQANVPAVNNPYRDKIYPEFALETTDGVCKRLAVTPGATPSAISQPPTVAVSNPYNTCDL